MGNTIGLQQGLFHIYLKHFLLCLARLNNRTTETDWPAALMERHKTLKYTHYHLKKIQGGKIRKNNTKYIIGMK